MCNVWTNAPSGWTGNNYTENNDWLNQLLLRIVEYSRIIILNTRCMTKLHRHILEYFKIIKLESKLKNVTTHLKATTQTRETYNSGKRYRIL